MRRSLLAILLSAVVLQLAPLQSTECFAFQRGRRLNDETFREFQRDQVPTPDELYRILASLDLSAKPKFSSEMGEALRQNIEEMVRSRFNSLSDEQKNAFRRMAQEAMSGNEDAFNRSDKFLKEEMGLEIPDELKEMVREQVRNQMNRNANSQSDTGSGDTNQGSDPNSGQNSSRDSGDGNSNLGTQDRNENPALNERAGQGSGANELGGRSQSNPYFPDRQNNGRDDRSQDGQRPNGSIADESLREQGRPNLERTNTEPDDPFNMNGQETGNGEPRRTNPNSADRDGSEVIDPFNPRSDNWPRRDSINRSSQGATSGMEIPGNRPGSSMIPRRSGDTQGRSSDFGSNGRGSPFEQPNFDRDNTERSFEKMLKSFQSQANKRQSDKTKGVIEQLADKVIKNSPTGEGGDNKKNIMGDGFEGVMDRMMKTIKGDRENTDHKEQVARRFDRAITEVAKRVRDRSTSSDGEANIADSVDSVFDRMIEKVHETLNEKRPENSNERIRYKQSRGTFDGFENLNQSPASNGSNDGSVNQPWNHKINSDYIQNEVSAPGGAPDWNLKMDGGLPSMPEVGWQGVTYFLMFVAMIGMIAFVVWRLIAFNSTPTHKKASQRKRVGKIRTPGDLIEAFDFFLINKFGDRSFWWNAKHAEDILQNEAPEHREKISELVNDYVEARYTDQESGFSEVEQTRHLETFQTLAKSILKKKESDQTASPAEPQAGTNQILPAEG